MNRVTLLLIATVVAAGAALFLKWDVWFGSDKPKVLPSARQEVPPLPDVRVRHVPIGELAPAHKYGWRKDLSPAVASAVTVLAIEGQLKDLGQIGNVGRTKKVPLDVLNELPGVKPIAVEDVEALGKAGRVDASLLVTIARDKGVPLEALRVLVEDRRVAAKFLAPFETLASTGASLALQEIKNFDGVLMLPTDDLYVVEDGGRERPVRKLQLFGADDSLVMIRDGSIDRWVVPGKFHAPVMSERMKLLCDALDGLAAADHRGTARHEVFGVDGDEGRRIVLADDRDETIIEFRLGNADMGVQRNARTAGTFVRPVGSQHVYRVAKNFSTVSNVMPAYWVDMRFVDLDYTEVNGLVEKAQTIRLEYQDELLGDAAGDNREYTGNRVRLVLESEKVEDSGGEEPAGPKLPGAQPSHHRRWRFLEPGEARSIAASVPIVDGIPRQLLLGRFEDIVASGPPEAAHGFDEPFLHLEVVLEGGKTYSLKVGNRVPVEGDVPAGQARSRYVMVSGNPRIGTVSEYTVRGYQQTPDRIEDPAAKAAAGGGDPATPSRPVIIPPDREDG